MPKPNLTDKKILVTPLNWGLGHATRSMPVIDQLLEWNATVILGGDGRSLHLLRNEYPQLQAIELPSYHVRYTSGSSMVAATLMLIPVYLRAVYLEHQALKKLIQDERIDMVISDNRYGMWSTEIPSVVICHQISIIPPEILKFAMPLAFRLHMTFLNRFEEVWIPDLEGLSNLSGILSHKYDLKDHLKFIGPLSRFQGKAMPASTEVSKVLVVLSGPEPQRTALEKMIADQAAKLQQSFIIVQGKTESYQVQEVGNIKYVSFMNSVQLGESFQQSDIVIARSGYSTIMDLCALGKKAVLIPTPGQTEQEYLARQLAGQGMAIVQDQGNLDLSKALEEVATIKGFPVMPGNVLFKKILLEYVERRLM